MAIEIKLLVWAAALTFVQAMIGAYGSMQKVGVERLAGNREAMPALEGWAGRAQRAHRNMLENVGLFTILALAAVVANRTNAMTALGAEVFFWARVVYAAVYIAGVPYLRTGVWGASIVGLVMMFLQLL
jgi:uncharacterized MAPEG superfamily protein